jgi:hypothetical protein
MAFYFWTKPFGACKKKEKPHQIKEVYLAPYKTRQNPKNLYVFPKVNNRKRHESFKNHNFFIRPKNTRKSIDHQKTVENHPKIKHN